MVNAVKGTLRTLALLVIGMASMAILLHEQPRQSEILVPYEIIKAVR